MDFCSIWEVSGQIFLGKGARYTTNKYIVEREYEHSDNPKQLQIVSFFTTSVFY